MIKSKETDKDRPLIILYFQSLGGHGGGLADKNSRILLRQEEIESLGAIPTQVVSKHIGLRVDVGKGEGRVSDGRLMVYIASTQGKEIILGSAKIYRSYD